MKGSWTKQTTSSSLDVTPQYLTVHADVVLDSTSPVLPIMFILARTVSWETFHLSSIASGSPSPLRDILRAMFSSVSCVSVLSVRTSSLLCGQSPPLVSLDSALLPPIYYISFHRYRAVACPFVAIPFVDGRATYFCLFQSSWITCCFKLYMEEAPYFMSKAVCPCTSSKNERLLLVSYMTLPRFLPN